MNRCLLGLAFAALVYAGCNSSTTVTTSPNANTPKVASTWVGIGQGGVVTLSGTNTKITFTAGKHTGGFNDVTGKTKMKLLATGSNPPPDDRARLALFELDIDADSLFTDDEALTKQLKGVEFLKVKDHAKITFISTKIKTPGGEPEAMTITGDLTVAGKKSSVSVPVKIITERSSLYLSGGVKLSLKDLGLTGSKAGIDDEVTMNITIGADPNVKPGEKADAK